MKQSVKNLLQFAPEDPREKKLKELYKQVHGNLNGLEDWKASTAYNVDEAIEILTLSIATS